MNKMRKYKLILRETNGHVTALVKILRKISLINIEDVMNFLCLPTNIHFLVKFRISKNSYLINNKPIFLKLRIFTNFNTVFPVVVLVFDFEEFSEEVLHGH
jgi:hypothetical protein